MKRQISLYIHIPFCVSKCNYCDFVSFGGCPEREIDRYIAALCREITLEGVFRKNEEVISIFLGGGTPSLLELHHLEAIFHAIEAVWEIASFAEITIEANPGTVDRKKLIGYRQLGINRISFGLQSTNRQELSLLGRIHTYEQFVVSYHAARDAGFTNINVDLMFGIPMQTFESYRQTLTRVISLKPAHISAYSLIVEEGTPFYGNDEISALLPDGETEQKMYKYTKTMLAGYGYQRYEISNYSLPGMECKHNLVYWQGGEYLGYGLAAASYYGGTRYANTADMNTYLSVLAGEERFWIIQDNLRVESEKLSRESKMEEFMFLGLRTMQGISARQFYYRFGEEVMDVYGEVIRKYINQGMLVKDGDRIYLTEQGIWVSNVILAEFLF